MCIRDRREKDTTYYECLDPIFNGLAPISGVEKEITRCILSEEEMSDNASAKLSSIRKEIHITQERVRSQLQSMIHSNTYKTMLQDAVITMRNGRYCVPVKAEYRGSIKGMVHDQSGSGSTPVSYTHLDVYKRQALSGGGRVRNFGGLAGPAEGKWGFRDDRGGHTYYDDAWSKRSGVPVSLDSRSVRRNMSP